MAKETDGRNVGPLNEPFNTLLAAAVLAPSGDNMQPWRFEIDVAACSITVCVDETRDCSPMNSGQRMSRIACGAAIENIVQTAHHNDWDVTIETHDDPLRLATLWISGNSSNAQIPDCIQRRHTNRRPYDGQTIPDCLGSQWQEAIPHEDGVEVVWITRREVIRDIAFAIGRGDAEMFGRPAFFKAFLSSVRFDLPLDAAPEEGLCVSSLELSAIQRILLPLLRRAPNGILSSGLMRHSFRTKAEGLVTSSSGLCLIVRRCCDPTTDIKVGQLMERCWLQLTDFGYQVQPMMSIPVLVNAGNNANTSKNSMRKILGDVAIRAFDGLTESLPAAILRFGRGSMATARTGRLEIDQVIRPPVPLPALRS